MEFTDSVVGKMMLPESVERAESVPSGVYKCCKCLAENDGDAPEIPVFGCVAPGEVCCLHPDNVIDDLLRVDELQIGPLEIDIAEIVKKLRVKAGVQAEEGEA